MRRSPRLAPLLALPGLLAFILSGHADAQTADASSSTPTQVFEIARPAMATITTPLGFGSGVVVGDAGLIVTNLHVIAGATAAEVRLANGDVHDAVVVVAADARRDLVVLRVPGFRLPTAALGDSDTLRVGDRVYALGAPKGLELSLSEGLVSALRDFPEDGFTAIQTTAPISPGSSGGALLNARGELVGLTTFKRRGGENLNFAIPVNYLRGLLGMPEQRLTLAEANVRYLRNPASASAGAAVTAGPGMPPPPFPVLAPRYRALADSETILVVQEGETAQLTIIGRAGHEIGRAHVRWTPTPGAFVGTADVRYLCGSVDTRVTVISSAIELFVIEGGRLRARHQRPEGINCRRNSVRSYFWTEATWWP